MPQRLSSAGAEKAMEFTQKTASYLETSVPFLESRRYSEDAEVGRSRSIQCGC